MNQPMMTSPRLLARVAGGLGFLKGVTAGLGQVFVLGAAVAAGNAAAVASNILTHRPLLLFSFAAGLTGLVCQLLWGVLFYTLFRPVSRRLSIAGTVVILIACAFQAVASLLSIAPLPILAGAGPLGAFAPEQLRALALVSLKLSRLAYELHLAWFGVWCVLSGWLIVRSAFVPRVFGILLAISGVLSMTFLSPVVGRQMLPVIAATSLVGQIPLIVWLVVFGVNDRRWNERAGAVLPRPAEAL